MERRRSCWARNECPLKIAVDGKRKVGGHSQGHGPHDGVQNIEVVMQEVFSVRNANLPVVLSAGWWESRFIGNEGSAFFHALQDDHDTFVAAEAAIKGRDDFFPSNPFGSREDGDGALSGIAIQPLSIVVGAAGKDLGRNGINAADVAEKVDYVCGALKSFIVASEHDAIPDAIGEIDKSAEKL